MEFLIGISIVMAIVMGIIAFASSDTGGDCCMGIAGLFMLFGMAILMIALVVFFGFGCAIMFS